MTIVPLSRNIQRRTHDDAIPFRIRDVMIRRQNGEQRIAT